MTLPPDNLASSGTLADGDQVVSINGINVMGKGHEAVSQSQGICPSCAVPCAVALPPIPSMAALQA